MEDAWHVDGMCVTGSHDVVIDDVFVPAERAVDIVRMMHGVAPGPCSGCPRRAAGTDGSATGALVSPGRPAGMALRSARNSSREVARIVRLTRHLAFLLVPLLLLVPAAVAAAAPAPAPAPAPEQPGTPDTPDTLPGEPDAPDDGADGPVTPPEEPVTPPDEPGIPGDDGTVPVTRHLAIQSDLTDPRPTAIDGAVATQDPNIVLVTFWGGAEACTAVQRVEVEETAEQVRVGVFLADPTPGQPCILIALRYATTVSLQAPLGERQVVDASTAPGLPTVPADYAQAAFDAWAAGDTETLGELAEPTVAALLAARPFRAEDLWGERSCDGAAGSTLCTWTGSGATLLLRVANETAAAGAPGAVTDAAFAPPAEDAVALWPYTSAEAAENTQVTVDDGSSPWQLHAPTVVLFFAGAELGWTDAIVLPVAESQFLVTDIETASSALVTVTQPARQGEGGIWAVELVASVPVATDAPADDA